MTESHGYARRMERGRHVTTILGQRLYAWWRCEVCGHTLSQADEPDEADVREFAERHIGKCPGR